MPIRSSRGRRAPLHSALLQTCPSRAPASPESLRLCVLWVKFTQQACSEMCSRRERKEISKGGPLGDQHGTLRCNEGARLGRRSSRPSLQIGWPRCTHPTRHRGQRRPTARRRHYLHDAAGSRSLVFDLSITHDRIGSSCHEQQNGLLSHPQDLDAPLRLAAQRKINSYGQQYAHNQNISFLPAIMTTSYRMHGAFLRLLFLQAHRETTAHFNATGMPPQQNRSDNAFRFKRAAFYMGLKSKVGLVTAKASALRINLNIQGCSVVAPPLHAPSHAPLLLPLLLSHNIPLPRVDWCVMGRLVHTGLGS
jgi:hypothetical protein